MKYKKDAENVNSKIIKTKNGRTMLLSKCAVCDSKKSTFMKKQETKGILISLGLKTPLKRIPLFGDIFF